MERSRPRRPWTAADSRLASRSERAASDRCPSSGSVHGRAGNCASCCTSRRPGSRRRRRGFDGPPRRSGTPTTGRGPRPRVERASGRAGVSRRVSEGQCRDGSEGASRESLVVGSREGERVRDVVVGESRRQVCQRVVDRHRRRCRRDGRRLPRFDGATASEDDEDGEADDAGDSWSHDDVCTLASQIAGGRRQRGFPRARLGVPSPLLARRRRTVLVVIGRRREQTSLRATGRSRWCSPLQPRHLTRVYLLYNRVVVRGHTAIPPW